MVSPLFAILFSKDLMVVPSAGIDSVSSLAVTSWEVARARLTSFATCQAHSNILSERAEELLQGCWGKHRHFTPHPWTG